MDFSITKQTHQPVVAHAMDKPTTRYAVRGTDIGDESDKEALIKRIQEEIVF